MFHDFVQFYHSYPVTAVQVLHLSLVHFGIVGYYTYSTWHCFECTLLYMCCLQTRQHIFSSCCCGMAHKWSALRCCQPMTPWCAAVWTSPIWSRSMESLAVSNSSWRFTPWSVKTLHWRNQMLHCSLLFAQTRTLVAWSHAAVCWRFSTEL